MKLFVPHMIWGGLPHSPYQIHLTDKLSVCRVLMFYSSGPFICSETFYQQGASGQDDSHWQDGPL